MPTIRERGGKFQAQVRIKEDGVIVFQDSGTFETRKQALTWGLKLEQTIATTGHVTRKQDKATVQDLMAKHEAYLLRLARPTRAIFSRYKNLRQAAFTDKPASKVTSADIIAWASGFREGRSPATVLNHLMGLSALFRAGPVAHSINSDVTVVAAAINHLKQLGVAAASQERDRRVTDEEIEAIALYHDNLPGATIPLGVIMRLLVALPRRRTELLTAEWELYDEAKRELRLRDTKHPTKVRNEVVPVPPQAQAIIATLPRTSHLILPYNPVSVSQAMLDTAVELGFENLHLHDLRHEGISRLFDAGKQIQEVARISGHTNWTTLKRYTHLSTEAVLRGL